MNEKTIIDFLSLQNKWWESKKRFPFFRINKFKRSDYYYLVTQSETKEATTIIGPRGVGKSTILLEIMRSLLGFSEEIAGKEINIKEIEETKKGIDKKRILYVTFEEPSLQKLKIIDLLNIYAKYILRKDLSKIKEKIYVFFDEIQNIDNWGNQIKVVQDLEYPIKIFISGSSSVNMIDEACKATRRIDIYSMHPLKFSDYLSFKLNDPIFNNILDEIKKFRSDFVKYFKEGNSQEIYEDILKFYSDLKQWQTEIELYFEEYLIKGGYPGLLEEDNLEKCAAKLRNTFWLGFHKDLVLAKGIKDPGGMKDLAEFIASISSCETNYTSLMKNSGVGSNTEMLKKYMYHLENAFLINVSNKYSSNQTRRGSSFKIYLCDVAIRNMLQGMMNELLINNQTECGMALETLVFDHALRLYFKIRPKMPLLYWKDKKKNQEVDIILKLNGKYIPIEIKKADSPSLADVTGLRRFCDKYDNPGLVVCGKKLEVNDNIVFLPHWLFTLVC